MIVTKYCSQNACRAMAEGNFRFGTLSGFAGTEGDGGLFDDLNEGKGALQVTSKDATGANFELMGDQFLNNTFGGSGVAIHVDLTTNANAFCAANGWHSEQVHSFIRDGGPDYRPNPTYTCYIEFDRARLVAAIKQMAIELWGRDHAVLHAKVNYGEREKLLSRDQLIAGVTQQMAQQQLAAICFTKPAVFKGEQEWRCLILHGGEVSRVETGGMSNQLKRRFTDAILHIEET